MFTYFDKETAPKESVKQMEQSVAIFGMLPNMHRILAGAPATYEAYNTVYNLFTKHTEFTPLEAQVVVMTSNHENRCHYCMAGHTMGMKLAKMPDDIIEALREGTPIADPKLEALRTFTKELLDNRGHIGDDRLQAFLGAGYTKRQALEVLCGLASKLISNFTNALAHTEVDAPMKKYEWQHPADRT
ncbi:carboxymuconolactone decarboxylase family protein [Kordiimonas pumila]|uniref:Carboxymuconolactone decarboxylase family protein n=1 Tax=Kordiimonas pumila TaxID=2161677 RepID=A0ABV7D4B5_9PROT|nr:carboxymuconolactone decarboxylase family protein [Kordiimonas pumila]